MLATDPEALQFFCSTLFETRINPFLENPYIYPANLANIPHTFETGSETELRYLTTMIVQSEPGLYAECDAPITVIYRAKTPTKRGYMQAVLQEEESVVSGRLQSLCDLALRLNTFTGLQHQSGKDNDNRLRSFHKKVHQIEVAVPPPSAHECAESLLMLNDWLMDKVRPEKRERLLGLDTEN